MEATASSASDAAQEIGKRRARASWKSWLEDGPAKGLRRQHKPIRTATGRGAAAVQEEAGGMGESDQVDCIAPEDLKLVCEPQYLDRAPAQQLERAETRKWTSEWGCQDNYQQFSWPQQPIIDWLDPITPRNTRNSFAAFPDHTGLGWDELHPKALLRLLDTRLQELIDMLSETERTGRWPHIA